MSLDIYHATMVRRWHTNPHLSHTIDPVGYHSGRMAILALKLWPCDWELVAACLTHIFGRDIMRRIMLPQIPIGKRSAVSYCWMHNHWELM